MNKRCQKHCLATLKGNLPGRSSNERGGEENEEEEDCEERQVKNEIAREVVASIMKKASAPEDAKPASQGMVGQLMGHNWDCSQFEERDEEIMAWHEEDHLKEQREEDAKMEDFLEQQNGRRCVVSGGFAQSTRADCAEAYVVFFQKVNDQKEKEVRGWSTEEVKDKLSTSLVEDTEEMIGWRAMSQLEVHE